MLRDLIIPAFFGFCILVALTFALELWTAPGMTSDEDLAARIALIDARLPHLRSDVLIHRQERSFLTAQRRWIVKLMEAKNDRRN